MAAVNQSGDAGGQIRPTAVRVPADAPLPRRGRGAVSAGGSSNAGSGGGGSSSPEVAQLREQITTLTGERDDARRLLEISTAAVEEAATTIGSMTTERGKLNEKLTAATARIKAMERDAEGASKEIKVLSEHIATTTRQRERLEDAIRGLAVTAAAVKAEADTVPAKRFPLRTAAGHDAAIKIARSRALEDAAALVRDAISPA